MDINGQNRVIDLTVEQLIQLMTDALPMQVQNGTMEKVGIKEEFSELPELMTSKQVESFLQKSRVTLWHYRKKGILIPVITDPQLRYRKSDVLNLIYKNT